MKQTILCHLRMVLALLLLPATFSYAKPYELRMLNHWDNLDGTIERGYAGRSIFWPKLQRDKIEEYARYNEQLGINAIVPNNVNASPKMMTDEILQQTKELADMLRPHGIKVYLAINFGSPKALGFCETADPLEPAVAQWWVERCKRIYQLIPDFGGFLVKANSEGQPGPLDYQRTHADGANMLARALKPYGGQVIWRAFVYSPSDPDRAKQAYLEFQPLDGQFDDNVIIQIKNGPIDFQPREPFSPLFAAMPNTKMLAELQITQEYLGHSMHTAFLAPMWTEFLADVNKVAKCKLVGLAGVSNVGDGSQAGNAPTVLNAPGVQSPLFTLCGNHVAEANWYAFGRLCKNPGLKAEAIAKEWANIFFNEQQQMMDSQQRRGNTQKPENSLTTLLPRKDAVKVLTSMLMRSREAVVDYMMPLGLHHLFAWGHHYGPEPYCAQPGARADWMPTYYHRADAEGLGFNRSSHGGTDATHQYPAKYAAMLDDMKTCSYQYLLWFHHVGWGEQIRHKVGGRAYEESLWLALCRHYQHGVDEVAEMQKEWQKLEGNIQPAIFNDMTKRLECQYRDAEWWRNGCLLYFQTFSKLDLPQFVPSISHSLDFYKSVNLGLTNYECPTIQLLDEKR